MKNKHTDAMLDLTSTVMNFVVFTSSNSSHLNKMKRQLCQASIDINTAQSFLGKINTLKGNWHNSVKVRSTCSATGT